MKKINFSHWMYSYILVFFTILLSGAIFFIKEYSVLFLILLIVNIFFCFLHRKMFEHSVVSIVRTLVGALFIFSGFVKGVDPIGTQYVIYDYLEAYHLPCLLDLSLLFSFLLNLLEFTVGVALLLNVRIKFFAIIAALMMIVFTATTWYDAVANPVPDCGCFGKAVILTNWQTFYKNLVLDAFVLILLFSMGRIRYKFSMRVEIWILLLTIILFLGFQTYNYRYLPCINFLDWKVGNRMLPKNPLPVQNYLTYKNKTTGEIKEYLYTQCPFSDPQWVNEWEFVSRRDVDPNPQKMNVSIMEKYEEEDAGEDVTRYLFSQKDFHFVIVAYDLSKMDLNGLKKMLSVMQKMEIAGYDYCVLTSSSVKEAEALKEKLGMPDLRFYYSDDTALKGMIRSNPGLLLFKDSVILGAWAWRNLPQAEEINFATLVKKNYK
ncbi:MAG: hypothetical protein RSA02_02655 [Bacteroidales bacterium]